jgi:two-component system sensor histidine kinase UhpB
VNDASVDIYGYTKDEFLKMKYSDITMEPKKSDISICQAVEGKPAKISLRYHRRQDRTVFPVEISGSTFIFKGRPVACGVIRDITERKKAEEALKENEESLIQAQKIAQIGSWEMNTITKTIVWSKQMYDLLEISTDQDPSFELYYSRVHPDDLVYVKEIGSRVYTDNEAAQAEYRLLTPSGVIKFVATEGCQILDEKNNVIKLTGIVQDVTERRQAEEQLKKSQEELRELTEHLQTVREEERTSIARELHDDIGQNLAALKIDMHLLDRELPKDQKLIHDRLESFMELTDRMTDTVGGIFTDLRPPLLDELGLKGVVGWYQREFEKRAEIKCDFQVELEGVDLSDHFSLAVFRILQESLTNVRLHSEATRVMVRLRGKDGKLELIVKDNGVGIKEDQIREYKAFGIIGMEERVRHLGGEIKIKGVEGKGTTVTVRIPLQSKDS